MPGAIPMAWVNGVRDILVHGERIEVAVAEHRLFSPKPFSRAVMYCTNERIIIVRKNVFGIGRAYKIFQYRSVAHITVEKGVHYSRLHLGLAGEAPGSDDWKRWVWGLDDQSVSSVVDFFEEKKKRIKIATEGLSGDDANLDVAARY